jgi:ubiquinone/menaquinone biosynthesis C-methylase UbiE
MPLLKRRSLEKAELDPEDIKQRKLVRAYFRSSVRTWDEIYDYEGLYGRIYRERRDLVLDMCDRLRLSPASRILEIGCGPGVITRELAQRGYRVTAIDYVLEMVEATGRLAARSGVGSQVALSAGDLHHLPFSDERFDLALVIGVIEWLPALREPLMEITRVLKRGGYAIISVDNRWALHAFLDPLLNPILAPVKTRLVNFLRRTGLRRPHTRPNTYSMREFDSALRTAGLRKFSGTSLGFGPFSFFRQSAFPHHAGVRIHKTLQCLADSGFPIIKSAGLVYVVLASRDCEDHTRPTMPERGRRAWA